MTGRREGQGGGCGLHCAHRTTVIHLIDPSNPFYRGGSASTETMPAASLLILLFFHAPTCEQHLLALR